MRGWAACAKQVARREDSLDAETDEQTGDYTPAMLTSWREVPARGAGAEGIGRNAAQGHRGPAGDLP